MRLDQIRSQRVPPKALITKKVLLSGPVGCAKTTIALALAQYHTGVEYGAGCFDIRRINCAEVVIDDIRKLIMELRYAPFQSGAKCRGYVLDELHVLPDKCEKALLIPLEEDSVNFWAGCTNHPDQVSEALRSRFSALHMRLRAPSEETIAAILIENGETAERAAIIARNSNGDLRQALGGGDDFDYARELLDCRDATQLLRLARQNPLQIQATLLIQYLGDKEKHSTLCGYLNTANHEVAAHQLVSMARRAGIVK